MKRYISVIFVALAVILASQSVFAKSLTLPLQGGDLEIMNANPFLKNGVGELPPIKIIKVKDVALTHEEWAKYIRGIYLNGCTSGINSHLGLNESTCLEIVTWGALHEYDVNYSKERHYYCALYPNTPRIQKIYEINPKVSNVKLDRWESLIRLIATVDEHGNVSKTSTLIKVNPDRRTAIEIQK